MSDLPPPYVTILEPLLGLNTPVTVHSWYPWQDQEAIVCGYEIHNNKFFYKVRYILPNGEMFGGGIVDYKKVSARTAYEG
jgi:hypothetical protein